MRLNFNYRGITKSLALEEHVETNLVQLNEFFGEDADCKVVFKKERKLLICELTVVRHGDVFRAEKVSEDMYKSVELAVDTLWRGVRKFKSKIEKNRREKAKSKCETSPVEVNTIEPEIEVKRKEVKPTSMTVAEAVDSLEQIGHDFFIFTDVETGKVSVAYRRDENKYGTEAYGLIAINK